MMRLKVISRTIIFTCSLSTIMHQFNMKSYKQFEVCCCNARLGMVAKILFQATLTSAVFHKVGRLLITWEKWRKCFNLLTVKFIVAFPPPPGCWACWTQRSLLVRGFKGKFPQTSPVIRITKATNQGGV